MEEILHNISNDHFVANFEELVIENQIQTAIDMLTSAEDEEQLLVIQAAQPVLLERFVQALDREDRIEVIEQLSADARTNLLQVLEEVEKLSHIEPLEEIESAANLIEKTMEEVSEWIPAPETTLEGTLIPSGEMHFTIVGEHLRRSTPEEAVVSVFSNPSSAAQRDRLEALGIDDHMLESALDPDEISRLEYDPDDQSAFIVMKRPKQEANARPELLEISSIGMLFQPNRLIIVVPDEEPLIEEGDRAESLRTLLLRIMAYVVNEFMLELKRVKRTSREIQTRLSQSIGNRELLRMFSLSEGLVYNINAIEGNGRALSRLRHLSQRLDFNEEEMEYLDDIVIDNHQCSRQAEIFSTVLGGLLDARGNIINNNMNLLLKNLTIINVVFLPLGVIAGMGGMSEYSVWLEKLHIDLVMGYLAFTFGMLLLGVATWWLVSKLVDRWGATDGLNYTSRGGRSLRSILEPRKKQ